MRKRTVFLFIFTAWLSALGLTRPAFAIPVFSRKYGTSCITCHAGFPKLNSVGEAFRRNGYQFPQDDEFLVKDDPIPMGNEAYKDMWPNSLWPNDIPHLPPVAFRTRLGYNQFLSQSGEDPSDDFRFPMDFSLLSAGTLGKDISFYASMVLAGRGAHGAGGHGGGHGGEEGPATLEPDLERVFVQFSNLFAWSEEEDEYGMRRAPRWIALPPHALNLRIGQFEPQVIAPWASIHRQLGTIARLPNVATIGGNEFRFEPALRGIELNGTIRQYNSYAVGLVNGNTAETAWDNNSHKDAYFRIARKWWGYPLDGVIGQADFVNSDATSNEPDEDEMAPLGLDFWREIQFETGVFGYFGRNRASVTVQDTYNVALSGGGTLDLELPRTIARRDQFERIGFDARMQCQDLDIFGAWIWGWDRDPISDEEPDERERDQLFTWFVEADYYVKPWLIGYGRFEQLKYGNGERQAEAGISRGVVGAAGYVRANMRVVGEFVINAQGNNTTPNTFNALLDFAY